MKHPAAALMLLALAAPLAAQRGGGNTAVTTTKEVWTEYAQWVAQSAEDMPEAKYGYRPTPEVRSFGQLIGHVAGSQYMFCAAAMGEKPPAEDDIEKTKTSKADLVAAIKASNDYCQKAYAQTDAAARGEITMFGATHNRLWALMSNSSHTGEHYGNIVTYLRMNGMVPPSSRGN
jgi:uncharacterized damage-inducible protein DinB